VASFGRNVADIVGEERSEANAVMNPLLAPLIFYSHVFICLLPGATAGFTKIYRTLARSKFRSCRRKLPKIAGMDGFQAWAESRVQARGDRFIETVSKLSDLLLQQEAAEIAGKERI